MFLNCYILMVAISVQNTTHQTLKLTSFSFHLQAVFLTFAAAALSAPSPQAATPYAYPWSFPYSYPYAHPYTSFAVPQPLVKSVSVAPAPYVPAVYAPAYSSSQYHSQDEFGQASYGYSHPGQAHSTYRDASGNVVGSYAYINPDGKEVRVNYVADSNGFRVASNDLPVAPSAPAVELPVAPLPVEYTSEVKAARDEHMAAVVAAKARNLAVELPVAPLTAEYTPEVQAARDEHMAAVSAAKARNLAVGSSRRKRQAPAPVDFTPEVRAAREEHFKAVEAAKSRNAAQDVIDATKFVYPSALPYAAFPYAHSYAATPYAHPYAAPYAYPYSFPAYSAPVTKTVLTPGHSFSYRVDV